MSVATVKTFAGGTSNQEMQLNGGNSYTRLQLTFGRNTGTVTVQVMAAGSTTYRDVPNNTIDLTAVDFMVLKDLAVTAIRITNTGTGDLPVTAIQTE